MRTAFINTLMELADANPRIWLLCGDLGFSVLERFEKRFPGRFLNIGVAEQNMAGIAAGIALSGKTVFIYSIGNFSTMRCLEQIRNDICYHGADVKVVSVGGGYAYGSQGYTHHAVEDVAVMSSLPGMEVFVPSDPAEVRAATQLLASSGRPSYLRLSKAGEPVLGSRAHGDVRQPQVLRHGHGVVLFGCGPILAMCLEAYEILKRDGIEISIISVPCIKPLNEDFVREVAGKARLVVTVEEHILRGGLHAGVVACLAAAAGRPPVLGFAVPEQPGKIAVAGERNDLLAAVGLSGAAIARRIGESLATG